MVPERFILDEPLVLVPVPVGYDIESLAAVAPARIVKRQAHLQPLGLGEHPEDHAAHHVEEPDGRGQVSKQPLIVARRLVGRDVH